MSSNNLVATKKRVEHLHVQATLIKHEYILTHVISCPNASCSKKYCEELKKLLIHGRVCPVRVAGGCVQCMSYWKILSEHSHKCKDAECEIPHCKSLQAGNNRISLVKSARAILRKHTPARLLGEDIEEKEEEDLEDDLYDARPHSTRVMGCLVTSTETAPEFVADNPLYGIGK